MTDLEPVILRWENWNHIQLEYPVARGVSHMDFYYLHPELDSKNGAIVSYDSNPNCILPEKISLELLVGPLAENPVANREIRRGIRCLLKNTAERKGREMAREIGVEFIDKTEEAGKKGKGI